MIDNESEFCFCVFILLLSIINGDYVHPGDVEHTHLVKGLDYALLNKVRSEIDKKPEIGEEADGIFKYVTF